MKNSESLKEFKKLNSDQITEKIDQLRKDLFDLRFKQATRQLNETHKFKIIKKQVAQLLTLSKSQTSSQIAEKIDELRKDLFDLRFKQATRQLNETHKFKIIKKQVAQLLTLSKSQSASPTTSD